MRTQWKRSLSVAVMLAMVGLIASPSWMEAAPRSEAQLIAELASKEEKKVVSALQELEKNYPTTTEALPVIKSLLKDERQGVRRKATRVLGIMHAELSAAEVQLICDMLKASDGKEAVDALKALRDLNSTACLPAIVACLDNPNKNVMRDACRTLAVVGNKDHIKSIEPLLQNPDPAVQKDARDAIFKLKNKS